MELVWTLLLLLPLCRGSHYQGTVTTFLPLQTLPNGSVTVEVQSQWFSRDCTVFSLVKPAEISWWGPTKSAHIDGEAGDFCHWASYGIHVASSSAPFLIQLSLSGANWVEPIVNGVINAKASMLVDLRTRSDTGKPNASPQTTVLPVHRVPYNCRTTIDVLDFDPDGDRVECRFADSSIDPSECSQCTPPSVLRLSKSCTLSFSATSSGAQGLYAVQLVMEDFPRTDIFLTQANGSQDKKNTSEALSKIPIQFLLSVESSAASCSWGSYRPFFTVAPRPGAQVSATAGRPLQIHVGTYSNRQRQTTNLKLMFSGPMGMTKAGSGRDYNLTWTPEETAVGRSVPVCFTAVSTFSSAAFSSPFRCFLVQVGDREPEGPKIFQVFHSVQMMTSADVTDEGVQAALVEQIQKELEKRGLPANVSIRLRLNGTISKVAVGKPKTPAQP